MLAMIIAKNVHEDTFCKKSQAVTLAAKTAIKFSDGNVQVDPQQLFQGLSFVATGGHYKDPESYFKFEMCSFPPALFDSWPLTLQAVAG